MGTLFEELPGKINRLECKFGPDNPYVKMLKEQLRVIAETDGKSTNEVYLMSIKPVLSKTKKNAKVSKPKAK